MAQVLIEGTTFAATVSVPEDGDARNAASITTPFQSLTDRTRTLKNRLDVPESTATVPVTANQSNWSPTGWSTADIVRADPDADGWQILGLDASAAVKHKTIINLDTALTLVLVHNDGAQTAGNKLFCPGGANFVLGPRSSVEVAVDAASAVWRVLSQSIVSVSAINVIGGPTVRRFLPLSAGVGVNATNDDWEPQVTGNVRTSVDGGVFLVPFRLPSGSVITKLLAGVSVTGAPGAGQEPDISITRTAPNVGTGGVSSTGLLSTVGSAAAGTYVIESSPGSVTVDGNLYVYNVEFRAASGGATETILNWVLIEFTDVAIGNS
jgi:hypothetical protein